MSLSDVCFDFRASVKEATSEGGRRAAAVRLSDAIAAHSRRPFGYGEELEQLRRACEAFLVGGSAELLERLMTVAEATQVFHDRPPGAPLN
jgi:hypothetical protein